MHIIYVDDEIPALENFRFTVKDFSEVKEFETFNTGEEALEYVKNNRVDVAFLDMQMPGIHGLELAKALKAYDSKIRVVFVTAFEQYALDAFSVDAIGYVLKPYSASDIHKELAKCAYKPLPSQRVVIETMPTLNIIIDGEPLINTGSKSREMLALLVDRGERGFSSAECISYLWPERKNDSQTQALCRMTWKRLVGILDSFGVADVIYTTNNRRYLKVDAVSCDLYRILDGEKEAIKKYNGEYLSEYDWSEERNAQLSRMIN